MLMLRMRWGDLLCSLAALALCASADAGGGGSARVPRLYLDSVNRDQPRENVQAVVEMDLMSFAVNTVGNKYKLVSKLYHPFPTEFCSCPLRPPGRPCGTVILTCRLPDSVFSATGFLLGSSAATYSWAVV
jgi:hypothetical protein